MQKKKQKTKQTNAQFFLQKDTRIHTCKHANIHAHIHTYIYTHTYLSLVAFSPTQQLLPPLDDSVGIWRVGNRAARVQTQSQPAAKIECLAATAHNSIAIGRIDLVVTNNQCEIVGCDWGDAIVQVEILFAWL